ncbi:hypothetical protein BU24DRAFT_325793, partial [Aaosphaeria arxii CBS 175.79]
WPFGARRAKTAKLKQEGRPTPVTPTAGGNIPPTGTSGPVPPSNDALQNNPSRRSARRKRRPSRSSTTSSRDPEKHLSDLPPVNPPFASRRYQHSSEDITALPATKRLSQSPHLRPVTQDHSIPYSFHAGSHPSLSAARERGKLQRPQSLRKSVNESSLVRRKSSKRKQHDSLREEEIRAMSMPLPQKRPAGNSGGMLRRDSKKVKAGLNRHFDRPTSNISLPLQDSIHSSMSGSSETRGWRVSALDVFSPRPTVRCSTGSQYYYTGAGPSPKSDTKREQRASTSREGKHESRSKTIDDLADTLDAGALREILERDQRRREKKRRADDERLRRRLERRAEKQKAQDKVMEPSGTPATPGNAAQGAVGLGIGKDEATPMEDVRSATPPPEPQPHAIDTSATPKLEENSQLPTPLDSPTEEPVVADAQAVRYSRASMSPTPTPHGHTRGPSNVSQMPELLSEMTARETALQSVEPTHEDPNASGSLHPVISTDTAATSKKESWARRRSSEGRRMGVFASFFRRGKRSSQDQARATPSEASFSNTSRESMSRQPLPAHLVGPTQPIQIKRPSSVPRRTMSKFREDLPEFPISPPDSRVQSPEVTGSAIATRRGNNPPQDIRVNASSPVGGRTDSPVSPGVPVAGAMSQSLASVDSEGSWLSGKPMKRRSNNTHLRSSVGSSGILKPNEEFNASYEELGIPDDEYFRRLTPQPDEKRRSAHSADLLARKASSTAMAALDIAESEDEEDTTRPANGGEELVHVGVGRQPTIVHRNARVKSTEALVSFFQTDKTSPEERPSAEDAREQESPISETETPMVQRARSVDLGNYHTRQLSAGSAKLLDI